MILFPILVTVSSAFRPGNTTAFSFHFDGPWTLFNFKTLFQDTLYLRWYWNTLIVAFFTMLIQVTVITLTGYAYSRYNFFGRKKFNLFPGRTDGSYHGGFNGLLCYGLAL